MFSSITQVSDSVPRFYSLNSKARSRYFEKFVDSDRPCSSTATVSDEKDSKQNKSGPVEFDSGHSFVFFCFPTKLTLLQGVISMGTCEALSMEAYDQMFNVNVKAPYHLTKLAIPHLRKTKGNIVNVSSVNGIRSFAGVCAYNMSKSALDQLTKTVALEVAADGIRVNAVNPGVIITGR